MSSAVGTGPGRALAAAGIVLLAACQLATSGTKPLIDGAGIVRTETRSVGEFDAVEIRHGIGLRLVIGSQPRVLVTAQDNLLALTTTIVSDGRLVVEGTQDFFSAEGITALVTTPTLVELVLRDAATGRVDGLDAARLAVHVDHGATLTMTGRADWLGLSSHGGCSIDLSGFVARDATVDLAQGVVVRIGVSETISGSAASGVALTISGHPRTVAVATSGGSMVVNR